MVCGENQFLEKSYMGIKTIMGILINSNRAKFKISIKVAFQYQKIYAKDVYIFVNSLRVLFYKIKGNYIKNRKSL